MDQNLLGTSKNLPKFFLGFSSNSKYHVLLLYFKFKDTGISNWPRVGPETQILTDTDGIVMVPAQSTLPSALDVSVFMMDRELSFSSVRDRILNVYSPFLCLKNSPLYYKRVEVYGSNADRRLFISFWRLTSLLTPGPPFPGFWYCYCSVGVSGRSMKWNRPTRNLDSSRVTEGETWVIQDDGKHPTSHPHLCLFGFTHCVFLSKWKKVRN